MGLLDDAIREHLELKRRHGADPSEVARQEREALGSGRVPPAPAADAAVVADPPVAADGPVADAPTVVRPGDDLGGSVSLDAGAPLDTDDRVDTVEPVGGADTVEPPEPVEPLDAPPPERGGAVSMSRMAPDEPDLDWSEPVPLDEPDPTADADPAKEDVLEETPEFLQETPEHDRLWFEQRPPKDFDF